MAHLQKNSAEAREWVYPDSNNDPTRRVLPIHEACSRQPTTNVISSLIGAYSNGVRESDGDGMLPLHHACRWGASIEVIQRLLLTYPDSLDMKDKRGRTAQQLAMDNRNPNKS
eukprot:8814224-Ditylum_brightwellii.AAC.1